MKPLVGQDGLERGERRGMLQESQVCPGRRWLLARGWCRSSELTLSAAGEKGKGARGVPQIKEVGGKEKLT